MPRLRALAWSSWSAGYFVLGISAIALWTYLFGHPIVEGSIAGSDSGFHLSIIAWLDRWFPNVPAWYPLQGAGSSSILQYPYAAHFFVVCLSRLTGLSLIHAFRLTQFLSVAATAIGIYILVWRKLANQTMAMIAGLLYPISQASWRWLVAIGLFSQSVSIAFFAPAFLLFDSYLHQRRASSDGESPRLLGLPLVGASVTFCLMIITHPATAIVFAMTILLYSLLLGSFESEDRRIRTAAANLAKPMVWM